MTNKIPLISLLIIAVVAIARAQPAGHEGIMISGTSSAPDKRRPDIEISVAATESARGLSGFAGISRPQLDRAAIPSGSITDALRLLPDPQFDYAGRDSVRGGEILPAQVSISGGKSYENLYLIDGIGNNNYINTPSPDSGENHVSRPAGTPQTYNLDIELLDNIEVYRSRVPAEFGGFSGGVMSATIRNPSPERVFGKATYRTTRSTWTEAHVQPGTEDDYLNSSSDDMQPEFEKHQAGLWVNLPLSRRFATIVSYDTNYSKIPLKYNDATGAITREQHRQSQTFLAKTAGYLANALTVDATFVYNPYTADYYLDETRGCDWTISQNSFDFQTGGKKQFGFGELSVRAAYGEVEIKRDAVSNISLPWENTPSKNWGIDGDYSYEGAEGDYENNQRRLTLKAGLKLKPVKTGALAHLINAGLAWERIDGDMFEQEHTTYAGPKLSPDVLPGPDGVAPHEQYFIGKSHTVDTRLSANIATYGIYAEDQITIGRFIIRPGVRFSYDDLFENFNLSPRLSALWHILGNDRLSLAAGVNRYHGSASLSYLLRQGTGSANYTRKLNPDGTLTDWKYSRANSNTLYDAGNLKTPYSDELSIEPMARLWGLDISFEFLLRHLRDGIARSYVKNPDGSSAYVASNEGKSDYTSYSFNISKTFGNHRASLAFSASKKTSNYEDFDTQLDSDFEAANYDYSRVMYNGELMSRHEAPARNYNRPWRIVGRYTGRLFDRIDLGLSAFYEDSAERIVTGSPSRITLADGASVSNLHGATMEASLTFDLRVACDIIKKGSGSAKLVLEVTNLFDDVAICHYDKSGRTAYYGQGRQLWAGMEFVF